MKVIFILTIFLYMIGSVYPESVNHADETFGYFWDHCHESLLTYSQYWDSNQNDYKKMKHISDFFDCGENAMDELQNQKCMTQYEPIDQEALKYYNDCIYPYYHISRLPENCREISTLCKSCDEDKSCKSYYKRNLDNQSSYDFAVQKNMCKETASCDPDTLKHVAYNSCIQYMMEVCSQKWCEINAPGDVCYLEAKCIKEKDPKSTLSNSQILLKINLIIISLIFVF